MDECKGPDVGRSLTKVRDGSRASEGEGGRDKGREVDRGQSRQGLDDWVKQRGGIIEIVVKSLLPVSSPVRGLLGQSPHQSDHLDPL